MNLNHLTTPCKPPTCFNTTTHNKTNYQHPKIQCLQEFNMKLLTMLKLAHTFTKEIQNDHKQIMSCLPKTKKKKKSYYACKLLVLPKNMTSIKNSNV